MLKGPSHILSVLYLLVCLCNCWSCCIIEKYKLCHFRDVNKVQKKVYRYKPKICPEIKKWACHFFDLFWVRTFLEHILRPLIGPVQED